MDRDRVLSSGRRWSGQVGLALLALGLAVGAVVALALAAFTLLLTARPPDGLGLYDEFRPPENWEAVAGGVATGVGLLAVSGAFLAGAVGALGAAGWIRRQPVRRLLLMPAVFAGLGAAIVAVSLVPRLGDGRERADCGTFTVERGDWTSEDPDVRLRSAEAIDRCEVLRGVTGEEVERLLGAPAARLPAAEGVAADTAWTYPVHDRLDERGPTEFVIFVAGGRVGHAELR